MPQSMRPRTIKRILYALLILLLLLSPVLAKPALTGGAGSGVWTLVAQRGSCFNAEVDYDAGSYQPAGNADITLVDWDAPLNMGGGQTLTLKPGELNLYRKGQLRTVLTHTVPEGMNAGEYVSLECADYYIYSDGEKELLDSVSQNGRPIFYYTYQLGGFLPDSVDINSMMSGGAGTVIRGIESVSDDGFTAPAGSAAGDALTVRVMLHFYSGKMSMACIEYLYVWAPFTAGAPIEEVPPPSDGPYYDTDGIDGIEDIYDDGGYDTDADDTKDGLSPLAIAAIAVGGLGLLGGIIGAIVKALGTKGVTAAGAIPANAPYQRPNAPPQAPAPKLPPAAPESLGSPAENLDTEFEGEESCTLQ